MYFSRDKKAYSVYLTLVNIHSEVYNKPSKKAVVEITLLLVKLKPTIPSIVADKVL